MKGMLLDPVLGARHHSAKVCITDQPPAAMLK